MKKNKSKLALTLALLMVLSATSVFAAEDTHSIPVLLTVEVPRFSVTVPASLPITIDEDGAIQTADNAVIINHSAGPIAITDFQTNGISGWETVEYGTLDSDKAKAGTKQVSMQYTFDDIDVKTTGADTNDFSSSILIAKGASAPLIYDAEVPVQKTVQTDLEVVDIVIVFDWYE